MQKRWLDRLVKWGIFLLAVGMIYYKLDTHQSLDELNSQWSVLFSNSSPFLLIPFAALWALNLGLEAVKWQLLIMPLERIPFGRALACVLTGQSVGLFTPNRTGEYLGKILFLEKANKIKAVFASLVGSFAQLNVTLLFGVFGMIYFVVQQYDPSGGWSYMPLTVVVTLVMLLLFFQLEWIPLIADRIPWLRRFDRYFLVFGMFENWQLWLILGISMLRYIVFSVQYILLLQFVGLNLPVVDCWFMITLIYLVQTAIPTVSFSELTVRGATASYFLGLLTYKQVPILAASTLLWITNLLLPAAIGAVLVFGARLFASNGDR